MNTKHTLTDPTVGYAYYTLFGPLSMRQTYPQPKVYQFCGLVEETFKKRLELENVAKDRNFPLGSTEMIDNILLSIPRLSQAHASKDPAVLRRLFLEVAATALAGAEMASDELRRADGQASLPL